MDWKMKLDNFNVVNKGHLMIGFLAVSSIFLFVAALNRPSEQADFLEQRAALVIRKVGHLLLLQAGDPSSRVLPVKRLNDGTFQLKFQSEFSFKPDTLVKIVRQNLSANHLPMSYMVSVFNCVSNELVYGFEINPNRNNIISCMGRDQPKGCYSIQITFLDFGLKQGVNPRVYQLGSAFTLVSLIGYVGFLYFKKKKASVSEKNNSIRVGTFDFYSDHRLLKNGTVTIELSDKESKLLEIFATQQNQLIERDRLLKEVWENDGIFTDRSLDMFVSRLRKILKNDRSIQITNIYGKGYKLEIMN